VLPEYVVVLDCSAGEESGVLLRWTLAPSGGIS
jgi:hypothetical protein